jgi:hypothetical protein
MEVSDPNLLTPKERAFVTHVIGVGWEDNIKIVLKEIGWEDENLIHLTGDKDQCRAIVTMVMNFLVLEKMGNFLAK